MKLVLVSNLTIGPRIQCATISIYIQGVWNTIKWAMCGLWVGNQHSSARLNFAKTDCQKTALPNLFCFYTYVFVVSNFSPKSAEKVVGLQCRESLFWSQKNKLITTGVLLFIGRGVLKKSCCWSWKSLRKEEEVFWTAVELWK